MLLVQFCSRFIYHICCDDVAHLTERMDLTTITLLYSSSNFESNCYSVRTGP